MKKITFIDKGFGSSYLLKVEGDDKKETWGKLNNETLIGYEAKAAMKDAKEDGYKIILK